MNLKELASLRHKAGHLDQDRHDQSAQHYESGLKQLAQARLQQLQNPGLLTQALQSFLQALQLKRSDPRPALAAAYIFILVGNGQMANRYLRLVLELQPNHPDALALQAQLHISATHAQSTQTVTDYDSLYEQVEANLKAAIHQLHSQISFQPVLNLRAVAELQSQYHELYQSFTQLEQEVLRLDQELDASELFRDLQIVEQACNRLLNAITRSRRMQALLTEMQNLTLRVAQALESFSRSVHLHEVKELEFCLEGFMDQCDTFADHLDALESEGYPIAPLLEHYQQLIEQLERLQDKLDEVVPLR